MTRKTLFIVIFLIFNTAISQDAEKYTLDYCLKKAMERNQNIQSNEYAALAEQAKAASAQKSFLPSFEFAGSYRKLSEIDPFSITMPTGQTIEIFPNILDNYGVNLSFSQPLFTGFRIKSSYDIAKNKSLAQQQKLEEVKNTIGYNVSDLFWKLVYAIETKQVIEESYEMVKNHLKDVKNLKENGMASENDVKKVEVQLLNMELMKTSTLKNIVLGKSFLCKMINIPIDTRFEPGYELRIPDFGYDLSQVVERVFKESPLLKSVEYGVETAEAAMRVVKSQFFPSIYLGGTYTYARPNQRILPLKDKWDGTWNAGISVQFNFWDWGKKWNDYQAAQNEFFKIKTEYESLKKQLELDVKRIFLEIDESIKKYQLGEKMVEHGVENYRISRDKYRNGMLLNSELLDVEVDLLKSKLEVTKSIMDFNIKLAELKKVAGLYEK